MGIVTLKRVVLGVCGGGKIIQVRVPPILAEPCMAYPQSFFYYIIIYNIKTASLHFAGMHLLSLHFLLAKHKVSTLL